MRGSVILDHSETPVLICVPMPTTHDRSTKLDASGGSLNPKVGAKAANGSLLDTRTLSRQELLAIFTRATELEAVGKKFGNFYDPAKPPQAKTIALMFFEPSTRTRMSFQIAASRLGHRGIAMELLSSSSLSKGETYGDTILNVAAMQPDAMVIRYGRSTELDELIPNLPMPIINAGSGTLAHPTQALLDAYTIHREFGSVQGQKVLIVGDIRHSRVARSNFDVLQKLGADIGLCGPESFLPEPDECKKMGYRTFATLDEGCEWATVYMGLRIQLERHSVMASGVASGESKKESEEEVEKALELYRKDYHAQFGLNADRLKKLSERAIIMHPGPINHGVEFSHDVVKDPRSRVMAQVANGVLIRAAVLSNLFPNQLSQEKVKNG